jgi:hypothetical protein
LTLLESHKLKGAKN